MARYVIGDLQGCYSSLQQLLNQLGFSPSRDRLLFTGDLVNRGPQSLECLRYVRSLEGAAVTVLGNHDLHLLAASQTGEYGAKDTLRDIQNAPDRDELLHWLREQPLAHEDSASGMLMVHAGIVPQWSKAKTLKLAREASAYLMSAKGERFLQKMYGNKPDLWDEQLSGIARIRFTINCLTRLRYCDADGRMDMKAKGRPGTQAPGLMPWFQVPGRKTARSTILCGHWSTLGQVHWPEEKVWGLDTGCVWGGCLTALKLDTLEVIKVGCEQYRRPGIEGD